MRTFQLVKPFMNMIAVENVMVGRVYGRNPAVSLKKAEKESREILEFVGLGINAISSLETSLFPTASDLRLRGRWREGRICSAGRDHGGSESGGG